MVAKVSLGVVGLGAIGIGGVAFTKPEWLGINKEVPWTPLSEDIDYKTTTPSDYSNKFGSTYKYYLVGATENKDWWEWSFEKLKKDSYSDTKPSDQFKFIENGANRKITKAFDNSTSPDATALNQICKKVYKEETTKIKQTISSGTDGYQEADVWKYCSGLGEKPKTISETDDDKQKYKTQLEGSKDPIGKDETNRSKLISTTGNYKFWEIRNKEFKGDSGYDKIETNPDAFFDPTKKTHIRDLCGQAYGKESADASATDKTKKEQVLKYCSIDKKSN